MSDYVKATFPVSDTLLEFQQRISEMFLTSVECEVSDIGEFDDSKCNDLVGDKMSQIEEVIDNVIFAQHFPSSHL